MKKNFQSVRLLLQLVLEVSVSGWELLTFLRTQSQHQSSPNIKAGIKTDDFTFRHINADFHQV